MENKYNAVVAGAGSIGALKPDEFDSPKSKNIFEVCRDDLKGFEVGFLGLFDRDTQSLLCGRGRSNMQRDHGGMKRR